MLPQEGDPGRMASVILIGWKYATTITVKLIYAPNKNTKFFLLQELFKEKGEWRIEQKTKRRLFNCSRYGDWEGSYNVNKKAC